MPGSSVNTTLGRRARGHRRTVVMVATALALVGCGAQAATGGSRGRGRPCGGHASARCEPRSRRFPASVLERVAESISPVGCRPLAEHEDTRGTAFAIGENRALTAYHVVRSRCFLHGEITLFGGQSAVVAAKSPANGLALLDLIGYRNPSVLRPVRAHIGERLALLGFPKGRASAQLRVTYGMVTGMNRVATLTGTVGAEILRDVIVVSAPAAEGESGGPAIDTTGHVVGVIEGGNGYITVLTPAVGPCIGHVHALRCE